MVRLLTGGLLAAAWLVVGIAALLPTTIAAVVLAFARQRRPERLPFAWFLMVPLILGVTLRVLHGMEVLPFLRDWLLTLAEMRPMNTVLAVELLSGERGAEGNYLMLLVGELATAACILFLSARPGMWARSVRYICDDLASNPAFKAGGLGLFFVVLAAVLNWALPGASMEHRRIDYYSVVFFPVAPLAACFFAAVGWQMLFADHGNPAPEKPKVPD